MFIESMMTVPPPVFVSVNVLVPDIVVNVMTFVPPSRVKAPTVCVSPDVNLIERAAAVASSIRDANVFD